MEWIDHVVERVRRTPVSYSPWQCSHIKVSEVFPKKFYFEMLQKRPTTTQCELLNSSKPHRFIHYPGKSAPWWWGDVRDALCGPELAAALAEKFGIRGKRGDMCILHDQPGNALGPHTDTPEKTLTGLFYLAVNGDNWNSDNGTQLLRSRSGQTCMGNEEHPWDDFDVVDLMPYVANTALFFPVTDCSWHAAAEATCARWLIDYSLVP